MIQIKVGNNIIPYESFIFNGGEIQVKIDKVNILEALGRQQFKNIDIKANITKPHELMKLTLIKDALDNIFTFWAKKPSYQLNMPYVPYARQDRVMQPGEALSIKVLANIINMLKFDVVHITDPHSDVTPALINNVDVIPQDLAFWWTVDGNKDFRKAFNYAEKKAIVSPDAGASKKAFKIAEKLGVETFCTGTKHRDVKTGEITHTSVDTGGADLTGYTVLIPDDICDGGRTFVELAKVLKEKHGVKSVILYVTHGIFANGIKYLHDNGIDAVFSYNWFEK